MSTAFRARDTAPRFAAYCAERLGGRVISIGADTVCRGERVLIVFPVYCENLPPPVAGFLRRAEAGCAALIATYGGMSYGRALYDAQQLFPGSVIAGAYVPTEHSSRATAGALTVRRLRPCLQKFPRAVRRSCSPRRPSISSPTLRPHAQPYRRKTRARRELRGV